MKQMSICLILASAFTACGCSNAIYFATSTTTAIEINAGEGGQLHAQLGYKRFEGLISPMATEDDRIISQAPSTLAAYDLDTGFQLTTTGNEMTTRVRQVFVTGRATGASREGAAVTTGSSGEGAVTTRSSREGARVAKDRVARDTSAEAGPVATPGAAIQSVLNTMRALEASNVPAAPAAPGP